jgi:hypothetical protein
MKGLLYRRDKDYRSHGQVIREREAIEKNRFH